MEIMMMHFREVEEGMTLMDWEEIKKAVQILKIVRKQGGRVYLFGNGGSHTTAGHFANDLMKMCRIRAMCIGDMSAVMMAYGNDDGWEKMFSAPLAGIQLDKKDCVIGISCGGSSENVLHALEYGMTLDVMGIGMTGHGEHTPINKIGLEVVIHAKANDIRVQEDLHLMICHAIIRALQENG